MPDNPIKPAALDADMADRLERMMAELLQRLPPRAARRKATGRPQVRRAAKQAPLTRAQADAIDAMGRAGGNQTIAAADLGIRRQSFADRYAAAMRKLRAFDPSIAASGPRRGTAARAGRLPTDRRGAVEVSGHDDRRGGHDDARGSTGPPPQRAA